MTQIATKTLAAIEAAFQEDQGARYRGLLGELMPLAGDAYSTKEEMFRNHLGASLIGRECPRELWYSFHWCKKISFSGRMLRLFNRGHLEEPRMVALLEMIGCRVWQVDSQGKQFRIDGHRGHFGGSLDAVAIGIPDLPLDMPVLAEFKTHGEKSFLKLQADGVVSAKYEHYIQMTLYMGKNNLAAALYCAVNKNTDELYMEVLPFDESVYKRYLDRSVMIIDSVEPPPRISTTPGFFKCRFCDYQQLCHLSELPAINCRTCSKSRIADESKWWCMDEELRIEADMQGWEDPIDLDPQVQRKGCKRYEMNPVIKK